MHSHEDCFHPEYLEHQDEALCLLEVVPQGQLAQPPGQFPPQLEEVVFTSEPNARAAMNKREKRYLRLNMVSFAISLLLCNCVLLLLQYVG
jgi:hypothetical protein